MKKHKRFHREVYFPPWAEESVQEFIQAIDKQGYITFSLHSVKKVVQYTKSYGTEFFRHVEIALRRGRLSSGEVFELYSNDKSIRKACFRFSFEGFPVDIVVVLSKEGTVVTIYITDKEDNHSSLDSSLYEKKG